MDNDLISREALKKTISDLVVGGENRIKEVSEGNEWIHGIHSAYREIENAPTVEPSFGLFRSMLCETCQAYATNRAIVKLADEYTRPHGEWIVDIRTREVVCSCCRQSRRDTRTTHIFFCNHCGADMRGNNNETN